MAESSVALPVRMIASADGRSDLTRSSTSMPGRSGRPRSIRTRSTGLSRTRAIPSAPFPAARVSCPFTLRMSVRVRRRLASSSMISTLGLTMFPLPLIRLAEKRPELLGIHNEDFLLFPEKRKERKEQLEVGRFGEDRARPQPFGVLRLFPGGVGAHQQHGEFGDPFLDHPQGLNTVDTRHLDVHQHAVRIVHLHLLHGFLAA